MDKVRHPRRAAVHVGAAEALEVDFLVRHRLHDAGAGDEHVGDAAHHEDEVGDGGTVDGAPRARAENGADLGHDARGERVAQEDVGVPAERRDALLDAGAARIVQADHGSAVLHRQVHHLADLFRVRFRQRPAEHGEVLRVDVDDAAVDPSPPRHHPVTQDLLVGQSKIGGPVGHEAVELDERSRVEQHLEPLARGHLPLLMLRGDAVGATALLGLGALLLQQLQLLSHAHAENLDAKRGQDNPAPSCSRTVSALGVLRRRIVGWRRRRRGGRNDVARRESRSGQHDPMMDRVDLEHLHLHRLPFLHGVGRIRDVRDAELRHRDESLDVVAAIHDHALVHQPHDAAAQLRAHRVRLPDAEPRILLRLLQAERDALVLGVDVQDQDIHLIALLHDFGRMLDALGPRHVGDVNQPVDPRLDFDERAERGEVADLAAQARAHRIPLGQRHPRILLRLLHAERDLLLGLVDLEHHRFDRFADRHELGRMPHVARPAHLGDVDESLDAGLELDERAVIRDRHDLALHACADGILGGDVLPGVSLQLLQAERDALALPVDVEDLHLELLADLHHLGRMRHAAVAHVGDVQQAIHAAQVDEGAEVGDVLDDALPHLIDRQLLHQHVALRLALGFEQHAARDDDVAAAFVELDDLELEALAEQLVDIRNAAQRDLTAGQERVHPHQVHDDAALDLFHERPGDALVLFVRFADPLPDAHEVGFLFRKHNRAFLVFEVLEEDFDLVTFLEAPGILELVDRHRAFRLEADVEDDGRVGHAQYFRLDDLAFLDIRQRPLVQQGHFLDLVGGIFLVETGTDAELRAGRFTSGNVFFELFYVTCFYEHSVHRFGCEFEVVFTPFGRAETYPGNNPRASSTTRATCCSNVRAVVSSRTASDAGLRGAIGRLESAVSRAASA